MSILIKGMEMPTGNNAISIIIFPNGKVSLAHDHRFAEYAKAIPVPPHGRLGDLDMVEAMIEEYIEEYGATKDENGYYSEKWCAMTEAEMVIQDAPTIIPAEANKTVQCHECSHWQEWKSFSEYPDRRWCDVRGYYTHPSGSCPHGEVKK